jgi:hypothetical protein
MLLAAAEHITAISISVRCVAQKLANLMRPTLTMIHQFYLSMVQRGERSRFPVPLTGWERQDDGIKTTEDKKAPPCFL